MVALALLSKETAVSYVLLIPLADWMFFRFTRGSLLVASYVLAGVVLGSYVVLRTSIVALESGFVRQPSRYVVKQFVATPYRVFVQPINSVAVDVPTMVLSACAVAALLLLFIAIVRRGAPWRVLAGASIILASTAPVYTYFFVREDLLAARYVYFAAIGWGVIVGDCIASVARTPWTLSVATLLLAAGLATSLTLNMRPWLLAKDLVNEMQAALVNGESLSAIIMKYTNLTSNDLRLKDGVPYEYHGVGNFINGYSEFVEFVNHKATSR